MQHRVITQTPHDAPALGADIHVLWMACPWSEGVSDYDRRHIAVFAQLLHWESEGADAAELAQVVFGLDVQRDRARTLTVLNSHLKRARWIAEHHFPMLGW